MSERFPGFQVDILYPDEYVDFIAEIYFKERLVCIITQENGPDALEVEFDSDVRGFPERMSLGGFEEAIRHAKRRLNELRK